MSQQLTQKLGIWGNESCVQCGACCYDYRHGFCENQEVRNGKSYCKLHEDSKRESICQTFLCSCLNDNSHTTIPRNIQNRLATRLVNIAIKLNTAQK